MNSSSFKGKYSRLLNELLKDIKDEKLFIMQKDLEQFKRVIKEIEEKERMNEQI